MHIRTTRYTDYFGINTTNVTFENLDAFKDTPLFLDPHLIRIVTGPEPYQQQAVDSIDTFLRSLTTRVLSHADNSGDLLNHIGEPKETHLGVSRAGYSGHAGAYYLAKQIWHSLTTDLEALCMVGVLKRMEDLPLFIDGIDRDITSDITTRVIFDVLADFTEQCSNQYPELKQHGTSTLIKTAWNSTQCRWIEKTYTMPSIDGHALVLVPKGWCRERLLGSAYRFFCNGPLGYIQQQQTRYDGKGKLLKPTKKMLKERHRDNIRGTSIATTLTAMGADADIVAAFWTYVDNYYKAHLRKAA